jgi:hypothetical protein
VADTNSKAEAVPHIIASPNAKTEAVPHVVADPNAETEAVSNIVAGPNAKTEAGLEGKKGVATQDSLALTWHLYRSPSFLKNRTRERVLF